MLKKNLVILLSVLAIFSFGNVAKAVTTIKVQAVIPSKADEVVMLKDFAKNVSDLTNGEVKIEVLPDGAVVL